MQKPELQTLLTSSYRRDNWKSLLLSIFHDRGATVRFDDRPSEVITTTKAAEYLARHLHRIGSIELSDGRTIALFEAEVQNTRIARNRVGLRGLVQQQILQNFQDGAFTVFFSNVEPEWRFSFITKFKTWNLQTNELNDFETHPKRYTYLFGTPSEAYRTAQERFERLAFSSKTLEDILDAFSVEALNDQFYKNYEALSVQLIRAIYPSQVSGKMEAHQGVLNLLNRLMFICFIQKKGWLMGNDHFVFDLWKDYKASSFGQNAFHEHWINNIFFSAFNGHVYSNRDIFKSLPEKYHEAVLGFPYLNGGLFTRKANYDNFTLGDDLFEEIFSLLGSYNFTIAEDTPEDINLEISPELLGRMYEGMINATDLDDVDAENGIVYTERPEINFMVRRSLVEVLHSKLGNHFSRDFLYHFCFDKPEQKADLFKNYNAKVELLREALISITACDPACGSGSMLLGMIQVQIELLRSIDEYLDKPHTPKDDYLLKKQIISECIYGVDIKEWAVRIAELRFWLYMIEEAEFSPEELTKAPLLPNLDFKLRTGNSLLQKFGSLDFTLDALLKGRNKRSGAARKLNDFIKRKKDFIQNKLEEQVSFEKLKEEECAIFKEFIEELVFEKRQRIKHLANTAPQGDLFGGANPKPGNLFQGEIDSLEAEVASLKKIGNFIKAEKRLPFSYDIDFMEVFLIPDDPGFDLIVGNPPYVRQEDILPPEDGEYLEYLMEPGNKEQKQAENKKYKAALNARIYDTYPFLATTVRTEIDGKNKPVPVYEPKVPGRSDLFIYFQLLCPRYLNSRGTFCFIISNSWLDVDYGKLIQHFLLKHTRLIAVYDSNVRSFSAKVNTVIYLHSGIRQVPKRPQDIPLLKPLDNEVRFVMNKIPYEQAAYAPLLIEQEHCRENTFQNLYRLIVKNQQELFEAGYDDEQKQFTGDKWGGKYLRAPEIYYTILEKGRGKVVPLKEVADVRFGIKTGANEFFILPKEQAEKWGIEKEFLVPFFTSPKDSSSLRIRIDELQNLLFLCNLPKDQLKGTNALKYILWGEESEIVNDSEKKAFHNRPSCSSRKLWYSIGERPLAAFNCNYMVDSMMRFYRGKVAAVNNFHEIHVPKEEENLFSIALNSTLFQLFSNILGRSNLGDGLMKIEKFEVEDIPLLKPNIITSFDELFNFEKRGHEDLFTELGFNRHLPIREQEPKPLPDRKALDDLIFDALDLTREERKEAYWATAELVKHRLDKAASHKERKKTRGARPSFAPPQEDEDIVKLKELIAKGENKQVEFKQSLRPGPGTTSRLTGVKHNILKSIAAFLNTEGGTLLIGVAPGNTIAGLEAHDYTTFSEADKEDAWRKHFDNTLQAHFGDHLQALIDLDIVKAAGKSVAIVRIKGRAPEPVWLKNRDERDREEFYIRRSASSASLEGREAVEYIKQVWG